MTARVRLVRLALTDVRGTQSREVAFGDGATLISGDNESGKSTLVDSIRLLFSGRECSPDDVRDGADRARIEATLDDGTEIARTIPREGSTKVSVRLANGMKPSKTQEYLDGLVGSLASFDPGRFLAMKPADQVAAIGEVLPCTLTPAHLAAWGVAGRHDLSGHGLTALARISATVGDERTAANAVAKELRAKASAAATSAATQTADAPADAPTVAVATAALDEARGALQRLGIQRDEAARAAARTADVRASIEERRAKAEELASGLGAFDADALAAAESEATDAAKAVRDLELALSHARKNLTRTQAAVDGLRTERARIAAVESEVRALLDGAAAMESAIGEATDAPGAEAFAEAEAAVEAAARGMADAVARDAAIAAKAAADRAEADAAAAEARAKALQAVVDRLRTDAPRELLEESGGGIEGLAVGPSGIVFEGSPFSRCSTSQRMRLAVALAIAGSPRAGWIQVDNLEAFTEDHRAELIAAVLARGRAFIGALVARSELRVQPIEVQQPHEESAA